MKSLTKSINKSRYHKINVKSLVFGALKSVLPLVLLFAQMALPPRAAFSWDAGTESRRHSEGTGGENSITILDTRPYWAQSTSLTNSGRVADCPAGYTNTLLTCYRGPEDNRFPSILANCPKDYTNMGLYCQKSPPFGATTGTMVCPSGYFMGLLSRCYKNCPPGYTNTGDFCHRDADSKGVSSMTCLPSEQRVQVSVVEIPRCYQKPVCPPNYAYWGFLCYIAQPGVRRTALSTVAMDVKQSGNTHLWIVNRAIELLAKSTDPGARAFAAKMNEPAIRTQWENGLWDGDDSAHADFPNNMGTHFYNPAGTDWNGNATSSLTYRFEEGSIIPIVGGILGLAGGPLGVIVGAAGGQGISGVIANEVMKNRKGCASSLECARAEIITITGRLDKTNAYALGLALHYMTDATQPMHTSGYDGFKIPNNLHPQYEYYVPFVQAKFPASNMNWDRRWVGQDPDNVLTQTAKKSNLFAPRLSKTLHISGDAGIVTIQSFNGIGPYTGYNIYNDAKIDALTGEILREAYQSTASYLYSVNTKIEGLYGNVTSIAPANTPATLANLTGNWAGYFGDGTKSRYVWAISQTGAALAFIDVGAGGQTKFSGHIQGNSIIDSNNKVGTLSADGRTITWSDGIFWVKQ